MEVVWAKSSIVEAIKFISSESFVERVQSFRRAHAHAFEEVASSSSSSSSIRRNEEKGTSSKLCDESKDSCNMNRDVEKIAESKEMDSRTLQSSGDKEHTSMHLPSYDSVTHTVEMTKAFESYTAFLEGLLENFLVGRGITVPEFLAECGGVVDGKFTPLFGEHEHLWFVELLQTWSDYTAFFDMMAREARSARK